MSFAEGIKAIPVVRSRNGLVSPSAHSARVSGQTSVPSRLSASVSAPPRLGTTSRV